MESSTSTYVAADYVWSFKQATERFSEEYWQLSGIRRAFSNVLSSGSQAKREGLVFSTSIGHKPPVKRSEDLAKALLSGSAGCCTGSFPAGR
jgi:hypothetical protein